MKRVPFFILGLLCLGGCARSYTVEVFNRSGQPVRASIVTDAFQSVEKTATTIDAGTFAVLGPLEAPITETLRFEAVSTSDRGTLPVKRDLSPGLSEIEILEGSAWGELRLDVRRLGGRRAEDAR